MGIINDYLNGIQKRYPATQEVREQIEELRDTLHMKAEELQAQGVPYDEASKRAVTELGDVTPLLDQVAGNIRTVYVNRLNRKIALLVSACILEEYLLGWLIGLLSSYTPGAQQFPIFASFALMLLICLSVWPLVAYLIYRKQPDKTGIVTLNFRRQIRNAILIWLGISIVLVIIALLPYSSLWLMLPIIGVVNWPISIFIYHRLLVGGRYDAAV